MYILWEKNLFLKLFLKMHSIKEIYLNIYLNF